MKARAAIAIVLLCLLWSSRAQGIYNLQYWGNPPGGNQVLPMRGYYSDAIRRRGVEFYASLTHNTNNALVFEAVRVNPDNSQEVFPGVITSINGKGISGIIPGRGTFKVKLTRHGARATGHLTLRRVNPGDIAVSGKLRMEGQSWNPETVTVNYGVVVQMALWYAAQAMQPNGIRPARTNLPPTLLPEPAP